MDTLEKVNADYKTQLNDWIGQERAAIDLISAIGKLCSRYGYFSQRNFK
jgi:hypothetical protein